METDPVGDTSNGSAAGQGTRSGWRWAIRLGLALLCCALVTYAIVLGGWKREDVAEFNKGAGLHTQLEGSNGGGDAGQTNGALWAGVIQEDFAPSGEPSANHHSASDRSAATVSDSILQADLRVLESSGRQLEQVVAELETLAMSAPWRGRGFFDAPQQDQIEGLMFRYLACRHALWQLANYHQDNAERYAFGQAKVEYTVIAMDAGFRVILADARLVRAFRGDTIAVAKLNEEFYRSRIPAGTYERLFLGVTSEGQITALNNSLALYAAELSNPDSMLSKVVAKHPVYRSLVSNTQSTAQRADAIVRESVATESQIAPDLENEIRHTRVAELLRDAKGESSGLLETARAHLFKGISRIKNPESHLIKFSQDQKRQIYELLEPGDIILTYTAGYISDIFIPGSFKHAITYVGSPDDRRRSGLVADRVSWLPDTERQALLMSVDQSELPSGQAIDVVEAVGEGVIFNHLGHILDTHINRLLVLRPQVNDQQRTEALANVLLFLGDEYDFQFDFADASKQVCTEVVYRAFDGKGPIEFTLVPRAGHETLSADDIALSYLRSPGTSFDFVLLADETPGSSEYRGRILLGEPGKSRLKQLMAAK